MSKQIPWGLLSAPILQQVYENCETSTSSDPLQSAASLAYVRQELSEKHRHMLLEESAHSPDVVAERGYRTVTRSEVPDVFKSYQRKNGLLIPTLSPSGNRGVRLRPDKPRVGKDGKRRKYEQPAGQGCRPDVHPRNFRRLRDASVPLWFVEGEKKADSLTSRGECVIALTGVWMFSQDKKFHPELEPIPYQGRTVFIAYDSDISSNDNVQQAAERLSGELEKRGARVLVVYLPDAPDGSKQGADDFLAAGGTVPEMLALARPFERQNVSEARLSKDENLRAAVAELERTRQAMPVKTRGENTRRSIMRALIEEAARTGKPVKGGVRVRMAIRTIAQRAAVSERTISRALPLMDQYLHPDNQERKADEAGAYVLFTGVAHYCPQYGSRGANVEGNLKQRGSERFDSYRKCDPGVDTNALPELRWSATLKRREIDKFGRAVEVREHLARLGKKRAAIVEYLLADAGGAATVAELMEVFGGKRTRAWDFKRRTLAPLEDPAVIVVEGDTVTLTDDWREALEKHREIGGEQEQARLQRERHARQREAYRTRHERPADPEPAPAPPMDDLRQPWPYHPEPCACRECTKRFGKVIGEHVEDCRCGECAQERREKSKAATRARLRVVDGGAAPPEPEPVHSLSCECAECAYPEPRYARPWGSA